MSLFGLDVAAEVFRQAGAGELERFRREGEWQRRRCLDVAWVAGPARPVLAAERTALNFLGHLSGIATLTARYVARVGGDRRDDPRHPQDDAGPAGAREGRGRRGRRHATTAWASTTRS